MTNVKIIFIADIPSTGKSTLCLLLTSFFRELDFPVSLFDCDPKQTLFKKRENERENDPNRLKDKYPIVSLPNLSDISLFHILGELNKNVSYSFFDLPPSFPMKDYLRLIVESDVIVSPFILTAESLCQTAKLTRTLIKIKEEFARRQDFEPKFQHILVPNMFTPETGNKEILDYWETKKPLFAKVANLSPAIGWNKDLLEKQKCNTIRSDLIENCRPTLEYIKQRTPLIEIPKINDDE